MAAHVFQPGDACGRNRVVRLIGAGGFSEVYEALDERGKRRALKVIATEESLAGKLAALEARLAQEGEVLARIEHVNVVRFHDAGVHGGHAWLLLELIDGQNLREALRARADEPSVGDEAPEVGAPARAPIEVPLRWIRQACEGVAEAHRMGAIHRDLKPENLLVTSADVVKVIDFGIAKLQSFGVKTTQQQLLGTALYMPPELIEGRPPDPRADLYAMGLVLYEALAGFHPIDPGRAASLREVCRLQLVVRPPPLHEVMRGVPEDLSRLVGSAIEKDPARRLGSMRALADGLHEVLLRLREGRRAAARALPVEGWAEAVAAAERGVDPAAVTALVEVTVDPQAATTPIDASVVDPTAKTAETPRAPVVVVRPAAAVIEVAVARGTVRVGGAAVVAARPAAKARFRVAPWVAALAGAVLGVLGGVIVHAIAARLLTR